MTAASRPSVHPDQRPFQPYNRILQAWYCKDAELCVHAAAGTGKTRGILEKLNYCAMRWAGMRGLLCRKTRASLSGTTLEIFENEVLPANSPIKSGANRYHRTHYAYPNGSEIVLGGLDNPDRIMSGQFDLIVIDEATECDQEDWEKLMTRLRNGVMPYQQIIGMCNPNAPTHWLRRRMDAGETTEIQSLYDDNPRWWDHKRNDWTDEGRDYIAKLDRLKGVRYEQLRLGLWVAAEGQIWPMFNASKHLITAELEITDTPTKMVRALLHVKGEKHPREIKRFIAGVDWGFRDPFVMHCYAIDYDSRMYLVDEIYRTRTNVNDRADWAAAWQHKYGIDSFWCDSAEPDMIELFNRRMNRGEGDPIARGALKDFKATTDVVGQMFADDALFILRDCCKERDPELEGARKATCLMDEIPGFVYQAGEGGGGAGDRGPRLRGVAVCGVCTGPDRLLALSPRCGV